MANEPSRRLKKWRQRMLRLVFGSLRHPCPPVPGRKPSTCPDGSKPYPSAVPEDGHQAAEERLVFVGVDFAGDGPGRAEFAIGQPEHGGGDNKDDDGKIK